MNRIRLRADEVREELLNAALPYTEHYVHNSGVCHGQLKILKDFLAIDKDFFDLEEEVGGESK